jgi:hypothetical protein
MTRLTVAVVGTDESGRERVYSSIESHDFDPDEVERLLDQAMNEAVLALAEKDGAALKDPQVEVTVSLSADGLRPSFHLSAGMIERLARAGASFDFDPYV